jgi:hypothetical protein
MKTPGKYRFSLQWGAETVEKIQAGEFLESLGNRKSELVVTAMSEYMQTHPEAMTPGQKPQIVVKPSFTREQLEAMIRSIIEDRMAALPTAPQEESSVSEYADTKTEIQAMLDNLDLFK